MSTLGKASISVSKYVITMEETLEFAEKVHADRPQLPLAPRLIQNTEVQKRHVVQPIEKTLSRPGFEERNRIYEFESKKRCPGVIEQALANAFLIARDASQSGDVLEIWIVETLDQAATGILRQQEDFGQWSRHGGEQRNGHMSNTVSTRHPKLAIRNSEHDEK